MGSSSLLESEEELAEGQPQAPHEANLAYGVSVIKKLAKHLTQGPGVYRMKSEDGTVLYVGKAINLQKRVTSYTHPERLALRIQRMIALTRDMEFLLTANEVEALILENNLIKTYHPPYNVLLRDDKTYLEILIRQDHPFPQIIKHRGTHRRDGVYFGPYASAQAVYETMNMLERVFLLRNCSDSVFKTRSRPCLQYQIHRCSAPCVGKVSEEDYRQQVNTAIAYLEGESSGFLKAIEVEMNEAALARQYERAAVLRDRMRALTQLGNRQTMQGINLKNADIIVLAEAGGVRAVQTIFYRGGRHNGSHLHFPKHGKELTSDEFLFAFMGQFYQDWPPPPEILLSEQPSEASLLCEALTSLAGRKVTLHIPQRGERRQLLLQAKQNALEGLNRQLAQTNSQKIMLEKLAELCGIPHNLQRVEIYDNSHLSGENPIGAMVVAGAEGFMKNAYRTFNIRAPQTEDNIDQPNQAVAESLATFRTADDYAMMKQVMMRRFGRALKEADAAWPDLVIVDGGLGQLAMAQAAFEELGITERVYLLAIAKGVDRNAGREKLFLPDEEEPIELAHDDPLLYFLQRLRDEAHRFAIGTQRQRRRKSNFTSPLDEIIGIGASRKRQLILHFGSARAVAGAGVADLMRLPGISKSLAEAIYDHFHPKG